MRTDFDIFVRNVIDKVSNQKALYYATLTHLCFCTTWEIGERRKLHFSHKCCISALPEFNQLLDFLNLFESRLIFSLLCDSLNLVINAFNSGLLGGAWFRITKPRALQKLDCVARTMHQCASGFPISQSNAEALVRWGGKTKRLISYFLGNTSAKKRHNRIVHVCQDYSKSNMGRFLRHSVVPAQKGLIYWEREKTKIRSSTVTQRLVHAGSTSQDDVIYSDDAKAQRLSH